MRITAYLLCFNEDYIIRQVLNHYWMFCNKIVVFDNHSDDGSDQVAARMGCEVIYYGERGVLSDHAYREIKNNCWKEDARTNDFVIVCDMDELLYSPNLAQDLHSMHKRGVTLPQVQGWNVYSELDAPKDDLIQINTAFPDPSFSKQIIFNPKEIKEINFSYGAHKCNPIGRITRSSQPLQVRHYRCLGGVQRMIDRHAMYAPRLSAHNHAHRLSYHYLRSEAEIRKEWKQNIAKCQPI